MTKKQTKILSAWEANVDDEMSTEYAIQYVADITGSTYAEVVGALSAAADIREGSNGNK